jgi:parvulin-like peptidyl-prolyl isomerase
MSSHLIPSPVEIVQYLKHSGQFSMVLQGMAAHKIIIETAASAGIKVELDELQQAADRLRLANNLQQAEQTWEWLQKQGLDLDDFEEMARMNVLSNKLAVHLFAEKAEPFFVNHQLDYAQVVLYEIILDDADLAGELALALQDEELDFHQVAHQYIQDSELRRSGGYRGLVSRSTLSPEVSAAVFAATPPQLLKPIVTAKGTHLILVEEIIQPLLDLALRNKIISDLFSEWLKQQVDQATDYLSLMVTPAIL